MERPARASGGFRTDVQGMRAVAVGLVIASHVGVQQLAGGFVGVDVFFVISGFLITGLLLREVDSHGRISLVGFYARRARRILPAAAFVALVTMALALALLPLVRVVEVLKDGLFASLFVVNYRLAAVGTDYFAQGEPPSPLQHYWSLAVEEQYYVVWPALIIALVLLARRSGRWRPRTVIAGFLVAVVAASFAWSVLSTYRSPTAAYFSTGPRVWELAIGSLVAVCLAGRERRRSRVEAEVLGALGLAAIVAASVLYSESTPFPGAAALLPVLGAALLIVGGDGSGPRSVTSRLLGSAPLRLVGDWSFSLYLWHWPVVQFLEERRGRDLGVLEILLAVVVTFVLSGLTYRFVETPFRTGRVWSIPKRSLALYPVSVVLVLAMSLGGRAYVDGELGGDAPPISVGEFAGKGLAKDPAVARVQASVLAAQRGDDVPGTLVPSLLDLRDATAPLGDCDYRTGTTRLCNEGDPDGERTIVLLGDSHARAWAPAISEIGRTEGFRTYNLVLSGCSAADVVQGDWDTGRAVSQCQDFKAWALGAIAELRPDLVVVATSTVSPIIDAQGSLVGVTADEQEFRDLYAAGFRDELASLKPLAGRVVVLGDTPYLPRESGACLSARGATLQDCLFTRGPRTHAIQQQLAEVAAGVGVDAVSAMRWFCASSLCPSVIGDFIPMRDREHVTPEYARELAGELADKLGITPL